jgi:hypothetical protein
MKISEFRGACGLRSTRRRVENELSAIRVRQHNPPHMRATISTHALHRLQNLADDNNSNLIH